MVQLWQEPDADAGGRDAGRARARCPTGYLHVFDGVDGHDRPVSLVHEDTAALRRMAVFDIVVNNADRKGGHVLEMADGHRYGVDHGVTFHTDHKLRTVLWGWLGEPLTDEEAAGGAPGARGAAAASSGDALGRAPHRARDRRRRPAAATGCSPRGAMPAPRGEWPAIPWPPF